MVNGYKGVPSLLYPMAAYEAVTSSYVNVVVLLKKITIVSRLVSVALNIPRPP